MTLRPFSHLCSDTFTIFSAYSHSQSSRRNVCCGTISVSDQRPRHVAAVAMETYTVSGIDSIITDITATYKVSRLHAHEYICCLCQASHRLPTPSLRKRPIISAQLNVIFIIKFQSVLLLSNVFPGKNSWSGGAMVATSSRI